MGNIFWSYIFTCVGICVGIFDILFWLVFTDVRQQLSLKVNAGGDSSERTTCRKYEWQTKNKVLGIYQDREADTIEIEI